jgi:hypothetical protein
MRFELRAIVPCTVDRTTAEVVGIWPDLIGGAPDGPPYGLTVGHRLNPAGYVFVQTSDAALLGAKIRDPARVLSEVAMSALVLHVNITLPQSVDIPAGLIPRAIQHVEAASLRLSDWASVDVRVDGEHRPGRLWRFAAGWTMVVERPIDGMWLAAVGVDTDAGAIGFVALGGVDEVGAVEGVLDLETQGALRRAVLGDEEIRAPSLHPDYLALP